MGLSGMRNSIPFFSIITVMVAATMVAGSHPQWSGSARIALLLLVLGGLIATGVAAVRHDYANRIAKRRAGGPKVSGSLVTLSSAAILAVYAAGYHRTGLAEDKYAGQSARLRGSLPVAAKMVAPEPVSPKTEVARAVPAAPPASLTPLKKTSRESSAPIAKATPAPAQPDVRDSTPQPAATAITPPTNPAAVAPVPQASPATALSSVPATPPAADAVVKPAPRKNKYADGTYTGMGRCRHGDIWVSLVIQDGKIASSQISTCLTRYPCSLIEDLPGQVVTKQSPDVDIISAASESSYAFFDAVTDALDRASQ